MAFIYRLEHEDGTPADPPKYRAAVPTWHPGDTIPLGGRTLRVVAVRDYDADQPPVLVVEEASTGRREMEDCGGADYPEGAQNLNN